MASEDGRVQQYFHRIVQRNSKFIPSLSLEVSPASELESEHGQQFTQMAQWCPHHNQAQEQSGLRMSKDPGTKTKKLGQYKMEETTKCMPTWAL